MASKEFRVISFSYMLEIIAGFENPEKTPLRTFIQDPASIRTLRANFGPIFVNMWLLEQIKDRVLK